MLNPNRENEDDEKYTSPDAHQLLYCAECFEKGTIPMRFWSEWGSGGYRLYTSKIGVETHNLLINKIYQIINGG